MAHKRRIIHHNTSVYNSRICGGGQVGTEVPAPPLRTSPPHCALIQNCFALLSRFARYSRIASHFVLPQSAALHSHSGLSASMFHIPLNRQMMPDFFERARKSGIAWRCINAQKKHMPSSPTAQSICCKSTLI